MEKNQTTAVQQWSIDEANSGQRIDNFLLTRLKGLPKSRLYRILRKGEVRVNKKRVKPEYRLQAGDVIRIPPLRLSPAKPVKKNLPKAMLDDLEQRILYEDKQLLVINKPAGMAVHGGSGLSFGLIESLRLARPEERLLELVHRLDRDTSGCLLVAKKPSVLKQLHELLRTGGVRKVYITLVAGSWPKTCKQVDVPLRKNQLRSGERMVDVHAEGKAAVTEFRVLQRFPDATLMEARPLTGRTHQIRVHALYAGHPIAGDEKYGDKEFNKKIRQQGCRRLFLHAAELTFTLPGAEQAISVTAPLAEDLDACLKTLM